MDISAKPEKIRQKTIAPLNTDGVIRATKAICLFDYYLKDSSGKWLPRLYLCEHRTLADIFLEAALFDPKKNILCISKAEWESSPEDVRKSLRKFDKIFKEPYQTSQCFLRQLFRARQKEKSILLPVTEDARGMNRIPCLDEKAVVRLCRKLEMPVCTVTFRKKQETEGEGGRNQRFFLDVKPLFDTEELVKIPNRNAEAAVIEAFPSDIDASESGNFPSDMNDSESGNFPSDMNASRSGNFPLDMNASRSGNFPSDRNVSESGNFEERKRLMLRAFLRSELNVEIPVEICRCQTAGAETGAEENGTRSGDGVLRADMSGITLETAGARYHRGPGALKSMAVYPGKMPETGERGTILIYPYYNMVFYLFTAQNGGSLDIQAATEQMYRIVSAQ